MSDVWKVTKVCYMWDLWTHGYIIGPSSARGLFLSCVTSSRWPLRSNPCFRSSCRVLCVCFVAATAVGLLSCWGGGLGLITVNRQQTVAPRLPLLGAQRRSALVPLLAAVLVRRGRRYGSVTEWNRFSSAKITFVEQMEMYIRVLFMLAWSALSPPARLHPPAFAPSCWQCPERPSHGKGEKPNPVCNVCST